MKGNFKTLLKRYCLQSTVLGLKYFYLFPDKVSRCFWALNMVMLFSLACVMALQLRERFDKMPTSITIENQYEPIYSLPYPAITVCSPNQITISSVRHLNKSLVNGAQQKRVDKLVRLTLGYSQLVYDSNKEDLEELQMLFNLNRYTIPEVLTLLPQRCEEFLRLCVFKGVAYDRCRGLFLPILTSHGLCCSFNSVYYLKEGQRNEQWSHHQVHLVARSGLAGALSVVADYDPADAADGTVGNGGAIRVMFTDWSEFPTDSVSTLVSSNAETFTAIHATYTYCSDDVLQLPVATRKCYTHSEKRLRFFREYHTSDCDLTCAATRAEAACGCLPPHVPRLRPERACNLTALPCLQQTHVHMDIGAEHEACVCLRDCKSRRYQVDMSHGNLEALPHVTSRLYTTYPLNKSSSVMHFFFPTSVYVKQKQETVMSLISLASNLGGVFGLCVGCSAISVVELLFYVYCAIRNHCRGKRVSPRTKLGSVVRLN